MTIRHDEPRFVDGEQLSRTERQLQARKAELSKLVACASRQLIDLAYTAPTALPGLPRSPPPASIQLHGLVAVVLTIAGRLQASADHATLPLQ